MFHKYLIALVLLGSVFLFSGCGSREVQYSPLNNPVTMTDMAIENDVEVREPISPADVRIFVTQKPELPYRELGVLSHTTNAYIPNEEVAFRLFKEKASEIGADGVIILSSREQGNNPAGTYGYRWLNSPNYTMTTFRGMAIQFIEEPAVSR